MGTRPTHIAIPLLHRCHRINSRPDKPSHSVHAVVLARRHHRPHPVLYTYGTQSATTSPTAAHAQRHTHNTHNPEIDAPLRNEPSRNVEMPSKACHVQGIAMILCNDHKPQSSMVSEALNVTIAQQMSATVPTYFSISLKRRVDADVCN